MADHLPSTPGVAPCSDESPEHTRERLIDVTITILSEQGDHALRLADVAREADVAVSTIYAHFRDRTDLVAAARVRQFTARAQDAMATVDAALDPALTAENFLRSAVWPTLTEPDDARSRSRRWDRLEAIADSRHLPTLASQIEEVQSDLTARIVEVVRRSQELQIVDPTLDPKSVAVLTQALRLGLALWDISGDSRPDPADWEQVVARFFGSMLTDTARSQVPSS